VKWPLADDAGLMAHPEAAPPFGRHGADDGCCAFCPAPIPIRAPAVAATDRGRRERGRGRREARYGNPTPPTSANRQSSPRAPAPRASRLRDGEVATRQPGLRRPPPAAHPLPPASGRGDGTRAAGGGTGSRHRAARSALWPPNPGTSALSPGAPAPRACRLRVGTPAKWPRADQPRPWTRSLPPAAHPPPPAGGAATDHGRRGPGRGARERAARSASRAPGLRAAPVRAASRAMGRRRVAGRPGVHRGQTAAWRWAEYRPRSLWA